MKSRLPRLSGPAQSPKAVWLVIGPRSRGGDWAIREVHRTRDGANRLLRPDWGECVVGPYVLAPEAET